MTSVSVVLEQEHLVRSLRESQEQLNRADGEIVLDFSGVQRLDSAVLGTIEDLVTSADSKGTKLVLRGVRADVYKVLKLLKLASRFSYVD